MSANAPNGVVSPDQLDKSLRKESNKHNVAVHSFDPDASPQEKAAAAGKGRDKLQSASVMQDSPGGKEVTVATGNGPLPTITVSDADAQPDSEVLTVPQNGQPLPGALPEAVVPAIPDWYRVGWRAVAAIDDPVPEGEEKEKSVLDMFLSEQLYGDWYHNAAVIFFAVFASHFLTLFHLGFGWHILILACCATYYSTSITRVRRRARDDIQRELVKTKLITEHESADWINNFLDRFWLIYEPVLSATIVSSVDQILSISTPPFLDSIRLSTFTLGNKAPRIESVKTFPNTADDVIIMDWALSFTPSDTSDLTQKQIKMRMNPKIVLAIRVGKGFAGATMPILLEDICFSGNMRIKLKLMANFPHVQIVDISFLEKPTIDYVLKPVGGEHGLDIANIPGLSGFIREMVHSTLSPMMYEPNVFTLNLEQLLSGAPLDTAIGVLQVTVHSARGLKAVKIGGGAPDPYVSFSINNRAELARTKYIHSNYNPTWTETKFLLINSLTETLNLSVFDYNEHRKDLELGAATFDLARLQDDATHEGIQAPILKDGKPRGDLRFDVSYYPVLAPTKIDGGKEELPDTKVGIVRLTIHQAKDLDHTRSVLGDLNPFAQVFVNNSATPVLTTPRFKHTINPVWEAPIEFLCADKGACVITVRILDDHEITKDPTVGHVSVNLANMLAAMKESSRDWWPLSACKSGRVRMTAEWRPLNMAGSLHGADQYVPPIGVVRLWIQKAIDVKNVEMALGGKSDPYVRVQVNNVTMGRTEVINNDLNPEWDQIIYIPVHSLKETMLLECMDYQHLTKDRSLGSVELRVAELAKRTSDKRTPYAGTGKRSAQDPIILDKGNSSKGTLHYVAEFVPAFKLKDIGFDTGTNQLEEAAEAGKGAGEIVHDDSTADKDSTRGPVQPSASVGVAEEIQKGHRRNVSSATSSTTTDETAETAQTSDTSEEPEGVSLNKDELLTYQSGVIVFNVTSGKLHKRGRLEVLLDDAYWPAFSTVKASSTNAKWDHVGEGFVKELEFGRVWLRLNDSDEGDNDNILAEYKGDAKAFLQKALDGPCEFILSADDEDSRTSSVEIEARYIPVEITLEARESINNQGNLRVDLLTGHDIQGVDRGGKSDPFVVFTLNGQKIFKSQTKKKTLTPQWNEDFTTTIPSRVGADFELEVFDWNQVEQAKSLGSGKIELADLEPMTPNELTIPLISAKHGSKGEIKLRLLFKPDIIAKSRKNTSTFSVAGRAMTQIGGLPVGGGKAVFHGVGSAGKTIGQVFYKDHAKANGSVEDVGYLPVPELPAGQASHHVDAEQPFTASDNNGSATFPSTNTGAPTANVPSEPGTLRVVVMSAKDLSGGGHDSMKPYVVLRLGDKEVKTKHAKSMAPEWNESFAFIAGPSTPQMHVSIFDHKTLGKDKLLGDGAIDIWRHVAPADGSNASEVYVELREGQGLLRLRLEFDEDISELPRSSSVSMMDRPLGSPSRFSLRKRPGDE